jgi:hypothetical protein
MGLRERAESARDWPVWDREQVGLRQVWAHVLGAVGIGLALLGVALF